MKESVLHRKIFSNIPPLESERLLLRKIRASDAADMFEYARIPEVARFTLWTPHRNISQTRDFIRYVRKNYRSGKAENWGIVYKTDGKFIGTIGFFNWAEANRKAEIHYALSNRYAGLGLMTEAVGLVLGFGFAKMRLNRIQARCMPGNTGSERVMQKSGMKYEGTNRQALFTKGKFVDLKTYSILKKEWSNNKS